MNIINGKMSWILGMDILWKNGDKFCKVSTYSMKDRKKAVVEVGKLGSGKYFTLTAKIIFFYSCAPSRRQ